MSEVTTTIPAREIDHNNECIGCGAHLANPCHPRCGFETGDIGAAAVLRGAASRLEHHVGGYGYDIARAVFATATELIGRDRAVREHARALEVLGLFLIRRGGAQGLPSRTEAVDQCGLFAPGFEIAAALYAAAAAHDGVTSTG